MVFLELEIIKMFTNHPTPHIMLGLFASLLANLVDRHPSYGTGQRHPPVTQSRNLCSNTGDSHSL